MRMRMGIRKDFSIRTKLEVTKLVGSGNRTRLCSDNCGSDHHCSDTDYHYSSMFSGVDGDTDTDVFAVYIESFFQ
jgi:hypothetical protein